MFPFAMQAKLVEAWFETAAASFAVAGTMGATAVRSFDPWLPGARRSYALSYWGPVLTPASTWPWSWLAGVGSPTATSWWQFPLSFYGDWTRAVTYGAPSSGWLMPPQAWTAAFPLAQTYSAFLTPFAPTSQRLTYLPTPADTAALFAASYRTASGHATAAMFDALIPPRELDRGALEAVAGVDVHALRRRLRRSPPPENYFFLARGAGFF